MDGSAGAFSFSALTLEAIEAADPAILDALPFGIVGLNQSGEVDVYNATEARLAGLTRDGVLGKHFFLAVAPCMNNYLVAQRFEDERRLDATIDYVLTFRMRPTPVKIRLLQAPEARRRYLLIQR
ncbi:MAG TPA: PAS domain-containing protein [Microvirga sp.]|jgi:photoactive yellow protein|nr:PAS domain-containing protein [Microvirga sp.]